MGDAAGVDAPSRGVYGIAEKECSLKRFMMNKKLKVIYRPFWFSTYKLMERTLHLYSLHSVAFDCAIPTLDYHYLLDEEMHSKLD